MPSDPNIKTNKIMNQCSDPDHGAINAERAEARGLRKAWVELDDKRQILEKQIVTVTEQRDRLAEAIRKHKAAFPFAPDFCDVELYEALQSLNPDHTVDTNDMTVVVKEP